MGGGNGFWKSRTLLGRKHRFRLLSQIFHGFLERIWLASGFETPAPSGIHSAEPNRISHRRRVPVRQDLGGDDKDVKC